MGIYCLREACRPRGTQNTKNRRQYLQVTPPHFQQQMTAAAVFEMVVSYIPICVQASKSSPPLNRYTYLRMYSSTPIYAPAVHFSLSHTLTSLQETTFGIITHIVCRSSQNRQQQQYCCMYDKICLNTSCEMADNVATTAV